MYAEMLLKRREKYRYTASRATGTLKFAVLRYSEWEKRSGHFAP
jgi:hypothetical protein